jgi:hypothetical protein
MRSRVDGRLLAVAAFAVVCCAGIPAIVAIVGGITVAAVVGVTGGGSSSPR